MTQRVKNGPIVRERDQSRPRELGRVLAFCILLSVPVFFYVWEQLALYQIGQEIQQMERTRAQLSEEGRRLDLERAQLTALGRVETIARGQLGMVDGNPVEMLALEAAGKTSARPREVIAEARAPDAGAAGAVP